MSPGARVLIFLALAVLLIVFVAGCKDTGREPVCVLSNPPPSPGHGYVILDDRAYQLGDPDTGWRTPR